MTTQTHAHPYQHELATLLPALLMATLCGALLMLGLYLATVKQAAFPYSPAAKQSLFERVEAPVAPKPVVAKAVKKEMPVRAAMPVTAADRAASQGSAY